MRAHLRTAIATGCFALGALSCDSLVDRSYPGPPLAVLRGQVLPTPGMEIEGQVSMTILWIDELPQPGQESVVPYTFDDAGVHFRSDQDAGYFLPDGGEFEPFCLPPGEREPQVLELNPTLGQSVTYEPRFPLNFEIPILALPPRSVQQDLTRIGGEGRLATGVIVAYRDTDGDGTLKLGDAREPSEPLYASSLDLTGPARSWAVLFLDGRLPEVALGGFPSGVQPGISLMVWGAGQTVEARPVSTPINLTGLTADSPVWYVACRELLFHSRSVNDPRPAGAYATCNSHFSREYSWGTSTLEGCNFATTSGSVCLPNGAPVPADWPCQ